MSTPERREVTRIVLPGPSAPVLIHSCCLQVLPTIPDGSVDAVVTDPPYASGGSTYAAICRPPSLKYTQTKGATVWPEFEGDQMGSHAFCRFSLHWMREAYRILRPGGYILVFTDWRQMSTVTDLVEMAGFVRRGTIVWDKGGGARAPHKGYYRHQSEFVVWGTRGPCHPASHGGPWPGVYRETVRPSDRHHMTGKPTQLMMDLIQVVPAGSLIVDPFMGSGTSGVASVRMGRRFLGCELSEAYFGIARQRIEEAIDASSRPLECTLKEAS